MSLGASLINKAIFGTQHTGSKPVIPDLPEMTTLGVMTDTTNAALASIPQASVLASKVNLFNQEQMDKLAEMTSPGRAGIRGQERTAIESMLRGELPKDVENLVLSRANARAQGGGYGGSGAGGNLGARDLGLTSLDMVGKGIDAASKWLAQSQTAPLFNLSNMFFSPEQTAAFQFKERDAQFTNKLLKAQVAAAPDPGSAAIATEVDRFMNTWAQFGMGMLGGMGKGGGGAPTGGGGGSPAGLGGGGGAYGGWGTSGSANGLGI